MSVSEAKSKPQTNGAFLLADKFIIIHTRLKSFSPLLTCLKLCGNMVTTAHKDTQMNIYISSELKSKFSKFCDSRGQKMSTVIQRVIKLILDGKLDPFEEKKDNG